jgi:hypothetical protein
MEDDDDTYGQIQDKFITYSTGFTCFKDVYNFRDCALEMKKHGVVRVGLVTDRAWCDERSSSLLAAGGVNSIVFIPWKGMGIQSSPPSSSSFVRKW